MGFIANKSYFVFSCFCVSFDLLWNRINFTSMRAFHFLFFFFLKENPTNNSKVTDLKFNRSVHKLFFDRMSKNFSLHTHWTRWFQLSWFDISVTAHHERLWLVFWIVMVDEWLSCYLYCQPLYYRYTFYIFKLKKNKLIKKNLLAKLN